MCVASALAPEPVRFSSTKLQLGFLSNQADRLLGKVFFSLVGQKIWLAALEDWAQTFQVLDSGKHPCTVLECMLYKEN